MGQGFDIVIERLGVKGDGVGTLPDGGKVFCAGALPGERVRVQTGEVRAEGMRADLLEVLEPSLHRAVPPCPHFGRCGGCALQHMDADFYARFKKDRVLAALAREGLAAEVIEGPFVSPAGSRRRAVFSAKCAGDGTVRLGFNRRGSHALEEIEVCEVLRPEIVVRLDLLRRVLPDLMAPGDSFDVALSESGGAVDLLFTVLGKRAKPCTNAMKAVLEGLGRYGFARVSWQENRAKPVKVVFDSGRFAVRFGGRPADLPPGGFMQATAEGEDVLVSFMLSALPAGKGKVADLYAGAGTFTFALLARGWHVDAFEGDTGAVAALSRTGAGLGRIAAMKRDLLREPLGFQELQGYKAVVIDPPRLGAESQMREIGKSRVSCVISISCNPDTFARDGAVLAQKGFRLVRLRIVDQFLWSPHVEVAGVFVRQERY